MLAFDLSPLVLAYAGLAILFAAFVRGLTGFGSSLIWVASLTLVMPMVLLFEIAASAALLPAVLALALLARACGAIVGA